MGEFLAELLGEIFGGIIEIGIDSIKSTKHRKMPDIEYKSEFTIKYKLKLVIVLLFISFVFIAAGIAGLVYISDPDAIPLFIIALIFGTVSLITSIFIGRFRCKVDKYELTLQKWFFIAPKTILWNDIERLQKSRKDDDGALRFQLYDKSGKRILTCNTDMKNAYYLLKMAENKGVKITASKELNSEIHDA